MYTTSRIHLAVCVCLPALLALVTFAQSSAPASAQSHSQTVRHALLIPLQQSEDDARGQPSLPEGQSQPLERAPQHEEAEANERYPNPARPPWTGPDQPDTARPGPYERFILPRSTSSTSRTYDLPGGRIYQDERRLVLRGYHPYAGYHCWPPADFGRALDEAYLHGRAVERDYQHHRFNVNDMNRRKARVLSQQEKALHLGLERLRDGEYARAVIALSLAAELDQGDPACRIHLAQARLALGHYDEAGKVLRRALQLQPKLVYADLHLERYYPTQATLDALAERLGRQVRKDGATAEALFLYGYLEFQRGRFDTAHAAFRRVSELLPKDTLTRTYLGITRPAETNPAEASTSGSPPVTGPRRAQTR
jgi:tetratricopeptide (TPR) repeat protein